MMKCRLIGSDMLSRTSLVVSPEKLDCTCDVRAYPSRILFVLLTNTHQYDVTNTDTSRDG